MLGEVPSVDVCSAIPASQYHKSSIWTLNAKAISLLPTFYDSCFISKACTKPSVFFSCLRTFFRLLFSFIYYLSCFIACSFSWDLITSSANCDTYMILSGIFQKLLDMYQITKNPKYLKVNAHPFLFIEEIIRILSSKVFSNSCFTNVLSDSSPTEKDFSSKCTYWIWKKLWFFSTLVWKSR